MASVGELFVSLGFDVDDQKLKDFSKTLKEVNETMITMGASALAALGALTLFMQSQANSAVGITNMATQWGVMAQNAMTFANALHAISPNISVSSALDKYKDFSNFINAAITQGKGGEGAGALARLGVRWSEALTPEEARKEMAANKDVILKTLSNDPIKAQAIYSDLLKAIPGLADTSNLMGESESKYQSYSKYNNTDEGIAALTAFGQSTAELHLAIDKFEMTVADHLAPAMTSFFNAVTAFINYLPSADKLGDALLNMRDNINGAGIRSMTPAEKAAASSKFWDWSMPSWSDLFSVHSIDPNAQVFGPGSGGGKNKFTKDQIAGIIKAFQDESYSRLDPNAYGQGSEAKGMPNEAYGVMQLHPDRQAAFKAHMGFDIHGSTRQQQLDFAYWEMTQGKWKSAGDKIAQTSNANDAYLATKKYYEVSKGSENIVINVHSNSADPQQVAGIVSQHLQARDSRRNAQTNPNGGY